MWRGEWPEMVSRGRVLEMARALGLGERGVSEWLAHDAPRVRVGEQWRYERDVMIRLLLDKLRKGREAGRRAVAAAARTGLPATSLETGAGMAMAMTRAPEGGPGSTDEPA